MSKPSSPLDPSDFISFPRRSSAIPNSAGTHALYTLSTYSFESHSNAAGTYILDLVQGNSVPIPGDPQCKNYSWIGDGTKVISQKQVDGATEFWIGDAGTSDGGAYLAACIQGSFSILKVALLAEGVFGILMLGPPESQSRTPVSHVYSSGREYSSLPVLGFDHYMTADSETLWFWSFSNGLASRDLLCNFSSKTPKYLPMLEPYDILYDTDLEFSAYSGVIPMGPVNCDLSSSSIVFVGHKLGLYQFRVWTSDLYFVPLDTVSGLAKLSPRKIQVPRLTGRVSLPVFSSNGHDIAFLKTEDENKITTRAHPFIVHGILDNLSAEEVILTSEDQEVWPLNPEMLLWSNDGKKLFISAAEKGQQKIFEVSATSGSSKNVPLAISSHGSISTLFRYSNLESDQRLIVTRTSYTESSVFMIIDPATKKTQDISRLPDCEKFGLSSDQVSEIWYQGDGDYRVHAWVVRPSYYKEGELYPLALFIHGGPLSSWLDSWSTRWNPAIFAEQGYIIVLPDITGSPGYSHDFTEAAIRDYGGRPYGDLERCFDYVEKNVPYADTTRAVALGGSYGGYLIFWLAGKPLGKKFKALVAHDGAFNTATLLASDVPDLYRVLMGGYDSDPSHVTEIFKKWDPAQCAKDWTTPMLIIHSDKDTRHPTAMGLAAFTTLQLRGVESRYLNFPDEGHFVLKPENSLHWHRTIIGWINKYSGVEGIDLEPSINERKAASLGSSIR